LTNAKKCYIIRSKVKDTEDKKMIHVTTYMELGRTFEIAKNEHGYWGFEDKYIDANGKLNKQFNGITGHLGKTLEETIRRVSLEIRQDDLISQGWDALQASIYLATGRYIPVEELPKI
jgi:hypothetical protein